MIPIANPSATRQIPTPTKAEPARIMVNGETFEVAMDGRVWFFRRSAQAGWASCSPEFVEMVKAELGRPAAEARGKDGPGLAASAA
jgi:hypothetical protein